MFKKSLYMVGASLLVLGFLFGCDAISYVQTSAGIVKNSVKDSVPIEFEIERARKMIMSLKPEIEKNMRTIAREEVEVERLQRQVARASDRLTKDNNDLAKLMVDAKSGKIDFQYGTRRYTIDQVKLDMSHRLVRANTNKQTLDSLDKVLSARERGLEAARVKLEQMLAGKRQLAVEIENLEARRKLNVVAQSAEMTQFDESKLSRLQDLITGIKTRLDVDERLLNVDTELQYEIPVDIEVDEDVVAQVAVFLGIGNPEVVSMADVQ